MVSEVLRQKASDTSLLRLDLLFLGKAGYKIITPGDNASIEQLGDHGYDNRVNSMYPIFYGFGPVFCRNKLAEPFRTVDIYRLMSHILRLNERKTNGSFENVKGILQEREMIRETCAQLGIDT